MGASTLEGGPPLYRRGGPATVGGSWAAYVAQEGAATDQRSVAQLPLAGDAADL